MGGSSVLACNKRSGRKEHQIVTDIISLVISAIILVASMISIKTAQRDLTKTYHVSAVNLLFGVYCVSIASYQILISALLLWKTMTKERSIFFCNLWYISHMSIVFMYGCFFIARTVVCFNTKLYNDGIFTLLAGILYIGIFFYFCIVVNSFSNTVDEVMFY